MSGARPRASTRRMPSKTVARVDSQTSSRPRVAAITLAAAPLVVASDSSSESDPHDCDAQL